MSLREIIETFYAAIWEQKDTDAIAQLLADNATIRGLEEVDIAGQRDFLAFHRMVHEQLDELDIELCQTVEQEEWVACRLRIRARDRTSGKRIDAYAHTMARIVEGRVVEGHNLIDFMTIFQQNGRLPPRALDHCLIGGHLAIARSAPRTLN